MSLQNENHKVTSEKQKKKKVHLLPSLFNQDARKKPGFWFFRCYYDSKQRL